jgi:hypothetical protein
MASPTGELGYGLENLEIIISTMYSLGRVGGGMNLPAHCGRGGTSYTASIAGPNRQAHFRNQTLGSQKWVICPERNGQQPVCFVLRKR